MLYKVYAKLFKNLELIPEDIDALLSESTPNNRRSKFLV